MNLSGCHQNVLAFVRQQNMNIGVSLLKIDAKQLAKYSKDLQNETTENTLQIYIYIY